MQHVAEVRLTPMRPLVEQYGGACHGQAHIPANLPCTTAILNPPAAPSVMMDHIMHFNGSAEMAFWCADRTGERSMGTGEYGRQSFCVQGVCATGLFVFAPATRD
jgi:hypothetical protein